jgi:hypothetical protein
MDDFSKLLLLVMGVAALAQIVSNRRLNPNLRLVARSAEGDLVQDLETNLFDLI